MSDTASNARLTDRRSALELMARLESLKSQIAKQEHLNYQLTRRVQELQTEPA